MREGGADGGVIGAGGANMPKVCFSFVFFLILCLFWMGFERSGWVEGRRRKRRRRRIF